MNLSSCLPPLICVGKKVNRSEIQKKGVPLNIKYICQNGSRCRQFARAPRPSRHPVFPAFALFIRCAILEQGRPLTAQPLSVEANTNLCLLSVCLSHHLLDLLANSFLRAPVFSGSGVEERENIGRCALGRGGSSPFFLSTACLR